MDRYKLYLGDCLETLRTLPDNSVDSVVTDPPYGIRFMGKSWDGADIEARAAYRAGMPSQSSNCSATGGHKSVAAEAGKYDLTPGGMKAFQSFTLEWASEALRVLKPGGHLLSFAAARTYHHMAVGIEMAGFEIRDQIMWVFGSGFPKSHNLKGDHEGWGTALKPAHEPICMARKPLIGTVAANVLAHGTGAINIDGCRVASDEPNPSIARRQGATNHLSTRSAAEAAAAGKMESRQSPESFRAERAGEASGRWPANLIHDGSDEVRAAFPDAKGQQGKLTGAEPSGKLGSANTYGKMDRRHAADPRVDSDVSAARFFYCAKTSRKDRNEGLEDPGPQFKHGTTLRKVENTDTKVNNHPTVKPTDLMAYLCRLVTPIGGTVLDPFTGSGSTGKAAMREGFQFIGCELDPAYMAIAAARIAHESKKSASEPANDNAPQLNLFAQESK